MLKVKGMPKGARRMTTTRMTRKGPWAAVLTALLAVLALVFGAMVAGSAVADPDPDKTPPGQSSDFVPPGQDDDFVPPGQEDGSLPPGQDDVNPGASHDKITICHKVEGKGNTGQGWDIITINRQAWDAHQAHHSGLDFEVTPSSPCPPTAPTYSASRTVCTDPSADPVTVQVSGSATQEAANAALNTKLETEFADSWEPVNGVCTQGGGDNPGGGTTPGTPTTPEELTAVEAATVEQPVEAATVEEAETVAVPAKAKVASPATIPAGDGSSVPTIPAYALALLALGATALAGSSVRLAKVHSE
jgi:hypothetical protein